jgi:hypothetical protein
VCLAFPVLAAVVLSSWGCSGKITGDDQGLTASDSGSDVTDAALEAPYEGGGDASDASDADARPIADSFAPPDDSIVDTLPDWPCAPPVFSPTPGPIPPGENVTITASGASYVFYTTDGTIPTRSSRVYDAGTTGIPLVSASTIISAFSSTLGATCIDSVIEEQLYTIEFPD